tara:strand:+ start:257 stop:397 length:141 start_codon:yes stop_codon:yes gene_type:complete
MVRQGYPGQKNGAEKQGQERPSMYLPARHEEFLIQVSSRQDFRASA